PPVQRAVVHAADDDVQQRIQMSAGAEPTQRWHEPQQDSCFLGMPASISHARALVCFLSPEKGVRSKGSAVSRGALMRGVNFYASAITGTVPADSGTRTDTARPARPRRCC